MLTTIHVFTALRLLPLSAVTSAFRRPISFALLNPGGCTLAAKSGVDAVRADAAPAVPVPASPLATAIAPASAIATAILVLRTRCCLNRRVMLFWIPDPHTISVPADRLWLVCLIPDPSIAPGADGNKRIQAYVCSQMQMRTVEVPHAAREAWRTDPAETPQTARTDRRRAPGQGAAGVIAPRA